MSPLALLHPGQSEPRCHDTTSSFFSFRDWLTWFSPLAQQGSHAQRTPLNVGALHCVTGGHTLSYKARTSGELKDTLHPLRLHTSTRGFDTTVELQEATAAAILFLSVCRGGKLASGERCEVDPR